MNILWIDFETRSRCDLPKHGTYNYAADKTTQVLICAWAINNEPVHLWQPWKGEAMPATLAHTLKRRDVQIRAHYATFERLIINRVLRIPVPIERFYCTSAQMRACALPGSLEDAGRALSSEMRKDHSGSALIRQLSIPQADGSFNNDRAALMQFAGYCAQDVETMRAVSLMTPQLDDEALTQYHASERINDAGLPIDTELCEYATRYMEVEKREAEARVREITGGALTKAKGTKATAWVHEHLTEHARGVMEVYKGGEKRLTLDADTRTNLLALAEETPEEFDPDVLDVIAAIDAASSSSVAKFERMKNMAGADGRLRGAFVLNGASQTGRYSSQGAQVHNFPRLTAKDPEAIRKLMAKGKPLPGPVLQVLKSMLRPAICAGEGRRIVRADWNAIEARGLPWLAASRDAERYLDAFRDDSRDIYIEQAIAAGLGEARQPGKVVVLALGYGGAEGALTVMAKGYGVQIENKPIVVRRWRGANRWAPGFWYALADGARAAIRGRGPQGVGRVTLTRTRESEMPALVLTLPSGRALYYPEAGYRDGADELTYLKAAWKPKADASAWPRAKLWHGVLAENATQGTCADLLRASLVRGQAMGLPLIGHVHDEIITEPTTRQAARCAKDLERCMLSTPMWAAGFPLKVEVFTAPRFGK